MRVILVSIFLLPYLYYGGRDHAFHFKGRKVSLPEHLVHGLIGVTVAVAIWNAFLGRAVQLVAAIVFFLVVGAIDEYVWHRGLPSHESDLHAKGHLALFIFVVGSLAVIWLGNHDWRSLSAR